jgi:uroporphyrin-III C-methyltransferase
MRSTSGVVYLVGAGPGDPGLLTVRAAELLADATAVFYDYLVSVEILARCSPTATLVNVGKIGHGPQTAQCNIERQLIDAARAGHLVVRLKGGDPFVFGRGAEEALALADAGIPFEVVPGVSAAVAVPAYAGIPVTARGVATSVAIVTGHSVSGGPAAIPEADTLVVLMGLTNAAAIRDQLVATGRDPATPAAVVQWGTCERERVVVTTLDELPACIAREGLSAPATIVIGEVVRLRERLAWRTAQVGGAADTHVQAASDSNIFVAM